MSQTGKPDLIITKVELNFIKLNSYHKPGEPVSGLVGRSAVFTVTVKNIGNSDFSEAFYISLTNNPSDISSGHYSHGAQVNSEGYEIPIDGSLDVKVSVVDNGYKQGNTKLLIQTDGKPHLSNSLPLIEELNYQNNTFFF